MFRKHNDQEIYVDLSSALRDRQDWAMGALRTFQYLSDITSFAYEPVSGLLAVGTSGGVVSIFGSPGVQCQVSLREPVAVRFLQFAVSIQRLVCLDGSNQLHVWDLEELSQNKPKYLITAKFDEASALTVSSSHSHAFITLASGVVRTYDLLCLRKSPYSMPNMWALYEEKIIASGMPDMLNPDGSFGLDAVTHPRNLNLIFVVYAGGIILSDLTERNTLRAYELVLPPGAPGGAGYRSKELLIHRRPSTTCMAFHPSGHFFAAGYSDGSIAFWAVEDEDQPLMVRTLDAVDVNIIDPEKIDKYLPQDGRPVPGGTPDDVREPIIKLSWSGLSNSTDPRGGDTVLTILGGTKIGDEMGLAVHSLPPFNPPEPPTPPAANRPHELPTFVRNAMRESVVANNAHFYPTDSIVQDYLLIPRDNPHFGGTFDPTAIILLCEGPGDTRVVEARQFPPPVFSSATDTPKPVSNPELGAEDAQDDLLDELAQTLKAMELDSGPMHLTLPVSLGDGRSLVDGHLLTLSRDAHESLLANGSLRQTKLPLKGGTAWAEETHATELRHAKYQARRVLITQHIDLTVQFENFSSQLLMGTQTGGCVEHDFPESLPHLKINLNTVIVDPAVASRSKFASPPRIDSIYLTSESLECLVTLHSGELFVYKPKPDEFEFEKPLLREAKDEEIVILSHISTGTSAKYAPNFMLSPGRGLLTAYAICDIGFVASAYADGSLYIVDMRGPTVILRHDPARKSKSRHSIASALSRHSASTYPVDSLTWSICTLSTGASMGLRLIAVRTNGVTEVFSLERSEVGAWECDRLDPITFESVENPLPRGNFVIDGKYGAIVGATPALLAATFDAVAASRCVWVICGAKSAKCFTEVTGEQVGKARWNAKTGSITSVQLVDKNGSHALVTMSGSNTVSVYSVPELELLHTILLPAMRFSAITMDDTGDFIQWQRHAKAPLIVSATYGTLFNFRRTPGYPLIELASTKGVIPPTPQPVSMGPPSLLSGWFSFGGGTSGDQIDLLLGGPDRPIPQPKPRDVAQEGTSSGFNASAITASVAGTQAGIYTRLQSALNERGQMLDGLQDRFNDLEEGSRNMVTHAKRLAAEKTAKRWLMF
ncbi:hypothetical protein BDN71DRAFT_1437870 [Pleurotus eryngii]|uniref:Lethal giant larvae (Lgl)-like C-terminal domain-containing protein n=1 Tax=Pleurotus eryngii TaxID=5323 RepID=A0A9P6ACM7_PLEER|nr:hypothetical protein BDN71DRAFT_1437870 [Pleurotus eryngii]